MTERQLRHNRALLEGAHHDFEKDLMARAYSKVHDRALSQDLVQDTFLKTWSYLSKGGKIEVMRAFLYHVLNHLIVDEYRKKKSTSLDVLLEKGFEPGYDRTKRLLDIIDGRSLIAFIQKLPKKYREVVRMRYLEDLSLKEMSAITHQSKNTVAVQIHRGIEKLKGLCGVGLNKSEKISSTQ